MNARITTKDVPVGGKTYRLTKMDARLACWLFATLAGKTDDGLLMAALGKCSREDFNEIQTHALKHVFALATEEGNTFEVAILGPNGSFSDPELAKDPGTVFKLTTDSIMFNVQPFLSENKSTDQHSKH